MNKAYAIAKAGGSQHLDVKHTQFSNINVAKDVWWIEVPVGRLNDKNIQKIDLLLYDGRSDVLYHLVVPTDYLRDNIERLTVRTDKERIQLELKASEPDRFRNVKPISSEVDFSEFVMRTI